MPLYSGRLITGRIFASEICGAYFQEGFLWGGGGGVFSGGLFLGGGAYLVSKFYGSSSGHRFQVLRRPLAVRFSLVSVSK